MTASDRTGVELWLCRPERRDTSGSDAFPRPVTNAGQSFQSCSVVLVSWCRRINTVRRGEYGVARRHRMRGASSCGLVAWRDEKLQHRRLPPLQAYASITRIAWGYVFSSGVGAGADTENKREEEIPGGKIQSGEFARCHAVASLESQRWTLRGRCEGVSQCQPMLPARQHHIAVTVDMACSSLTASTRKRESTMGKGRHRRWRVSLVCTCIVMVKGNA